MNQENPDREVQESPGFIRGEHVNRPNNQPLVGGDRMLVLLAAVDNALRNGSHMTGANLAFREICRRLNVDRSSLPPFDPQWGKRPYPRDREEPPA